MASTLTIGGRTIYIDDCYKCGVNIYIPKSLYLRLQDEGPSGEFFCVNGHAQCYTVSKREEMRRERDQIKQRLAQRDDALRAERERRRSAERSASAYKGVATKVKRRVGNGVCPCCNRTFKDLARHMAGQHPEYGDDTPSKATD